MRFVLVKEIIERFYYKKRFKLYFVGFLSLIASLFEYLGLILIFQFVLILSNPDGKYCSSLIKIFQNYFNIDNFAHVSLFLGISIALIYIFKNLYMFLFVKINSAILQDLSVNMALKIVKNLLYGDFVKINSLSNNQKQAIISKTDIVVWEYFTQYINLITNVAIVIMLIVFLFIKFTIPAVVAFCFLSILSLIEYKILKHKSNYQNKYFAIYFDALTKTIYTIINAAKEIRLNNKSAEFLEQSRKKYENLASINRQSAANSVFHIYFTEISIMVTFIVVLLILFYTTGFNNGRIIAMLGAIVAVILRITPAINRAQSAVYGINSNEKIALDLIEFDKTYGNIGDIYETSEKLPFNKDIQLKNISFAYKDNGLRDINLTINKGEFIGIVGRSGCYKTTLSLIIAGLIKAKGKILIDNNLLEGDKYNKWQNNVAILSQDFGILNENIFDGLNKEIIEKFELSDFNKNPLDLSYGQKQLAALAHIIAQDKQVLILDEITSSLDVLSEDKINKILLELKGQKTIISIAHRLQILKYCDRIIYMNNAKIIDIDSFVNLDSNYKEFREIIRLSNFKL